MATTPVPSRYSLRHLPTAALIAFMVSVAITIIALAMSFFGEPHTLSTYISTFLFVAGLMLSIGIPLHYVEMAEQTYICQYCDYIIVGAPEAICRGCVIDRYGIDPGENYNRFSELNPGKKP